MMMLTARGLQIKSRVLLTIRPHLLSELERLYHAIDTCNYWGEKGTGGGTGEHFLTALPGSAWFHLFFISFFQLEFQFHYIH